MNVWNFIWLWLNTFAVPVMWCLHNCIFLMTCFIVFLKNMHSYIMMNNRKMFYAQLYHFGKATLISDCRINILVQKVLLILLDTQRYEHVIGGRGAAVSVQSSFLQKKLVF